MYCLQWTEQLFPVRSSLLCEGDHHSYGWRCAWVAYFTPLFGADVVVFLQRPWPLSSAVGSCIHGQCRNLVIRYVQTGLWCMTILVHFGYFSRSHYRPLLELYGATMVTNGSFFLVVATRGLKAHWIPPDTLVRHPKAFFHAKRACFRPYLDGLITLGALHHKIYLTIHLYMS